MQNKKLKEKKINIKIKEQWNHTWNEFLKFYLESIMLIMEEEEWYSFYKTKSLSHCISSV